MIKPALKLAVRAIWVLLAIVLGGCTDSTVMPLAVSPTSNDSAGPELEAILLEAFPPEEVAIAEEAFVVGVSVGDRSRAYLIDALKQTDPATAPGTESDCQVVNDLLGNVPVTVTYCTRTDYCRVLTTRGSQALRISVGGRSERGLELLVDGKRYAQSDSGLPLEDLGFQTTTWRLWKSQHPQTDIYIGRLDDG